MPEEQALPDQERLTDTFPIGIIQLDAGENCVHANQRWCEMTGRPSESALGHGFKNAVHPADRRELSEHFRAFVANGRQRVSEPIQARHLMPDGSTKWFQAQTSKEFDEAGKVSGFVTAICDCPARADVEAERSIVSDRHQLILKSASVGIWEWNPSTNVLVWDDGMMSIYGVDPVNFSGVGEEWEKRVHPNDLNRMTQTEYPRLVDKGHISTEFRIIRDDGQCRHIFANQIVHRDEDGQVAMISGLNIDVTDRKNAERALEESENKFQRVAEHLPGVVYRYVVHADGSDEFSYVSSQVREMFELEPEAAIGDASAIWSRAHPDDHERIGRKIVASAQTLQPFLCEHRLKLPDKGIRWVQSFARPIRTDDGGVIWDGIVVDHTERKSAELALQKSQEQFHRMTENVPGVIFQYVLRTDGTHQLLYISSRTREIFGIDTDAAMADVDALFERIHPDDLPGFQTAIQVSAQTLSEFKREYRIVLDDHTVWAETTSLPHRLSNGDIVWDGIVIDITRRKEIALALKESQAQFERMTENVPGMICRYVLHSDGTEKLSYVSSQCREMFGVEPEEAMKDINRLFKFIHPEDLVRFYASLRQAAQRLQPVNEEFRVVLPEHGLRWRQAIGQPTRIDGGATVFDGVIFDITHAKRSEMQLRYANQELATATKMKDQFLANMSHEFRTPLNAILGMTEGLRNGLYGPLNAKQCEGLGVVEQSGMHLLELINDILDLARIESGQMKLDRSPVDIKGLCESSLRLVTLQAQKKNVQLKLNASWNLPEIYADEKRLRQILINLLVNAIKFTPEDGTTTLELEQVSRADAKQEDLLRISVIDSGIGIPPSLVDAVFQPFVQVDSSLSRKHDGSGLGLSLVRQFVELHDGDVTVTSTPGIGSCFCVELPYRQPPPSAREPELRALEQEQHRLDQAHGRLAVWGHFDANCFDPNQCSTDDGEPGHSHPNIFEDEKTSPVILLAEDNDSVALTVTWFLEARGYQIRRAVDGEDAIETATNCRPDLILMDIQMPKMDGFTAIRQIRKMPEISETPIIAVTGLAMGADPGRCLTAGANDYVCKPYRMEDLAQLIEKLLAKHAPAKT